MGPRKPSNGDVDCPPPMDPNKQKEQFSVAYVHAVAAVAGVKVLRTDVDDDSIDIGLERSGRCAPKLDLQLKCTADPLPADGDLSLVLKIKNYNDLRRRTLAPRWLVTLFVPPDSRDWMEISSSPAEFVLRRCAWWTSIAGEPDIDNSTAVTVKLPRANLFTPEALNAKLDAIEATFRST